MAVLRESPWYQEILRKGREEGRQEGRISLVLKLLNRRVGTLSPEITVQVQALSLEQLEALGEALLDFLEMSDLVNWLATHS
jgi:predicted transposase YdaD